LPSHAIRPQKRWAIVGICLILYEASEWMIIACEIFDNSHDQCVFAKRSGPGRSPIRPVDHPSRRQRWFHALPSPDRLARGEPALRSAKHEATAGRSRPRIGENEATVGRSQPRIGENEATAGWSRPRIGENEATAGWSRPRIGENEATIIGVAARAWVIAILS